jgi:RNA polymerase sigma-70 factor (ECF subfamily)
MLDFTEIYDEQLERVYGFIAYRVASRADAEDLTQKTFERALSHWADYDRNRASVTTWLLSIARNAVIDHYRAGSRRATVDLDEVAESQLPSVAAPELDLVVTPELGAALAALGDRERELIALRFGADLTGREIARVTGLTLANVQQILSRAMRKLRAALDQTADEPNDPRVNALTPAKSELDTDQSVG